MSWAPANKVTPEGETFAAPSPPDGPYVLARRLKGEIEDLYWDVFTGGDDPTEWAAPFAQKMVRRLVRMEEELRILRAQHEEALT